MPFSNQPPASRISYETPQLEGERITIPGSKGVFRILASSKQTGGVFNGDGTAPRGGSVFVADPVHAGRRRHTPRAHQPGQRRIPGVAAAVGAGIRGSPPVGADGERGGIYPRAHPAHPRRAGDRIRQHDRACGHDGGGIRVRGIPQRAGGQGGDHRAVPGWASRGDCCEGLKRDLIQSN